MRVVIIILVFSGCVINAGSANNKKSRSVKKIERAQTAGDAILRYVPDGANLLLEFDLERVRKNEKVGKAFESGSSDLSMVGVAKISTLVLAGFHVGTKEAGMLIFVKSKSKPEETFTRVHGDIYVAGPPQLKKRIAPMKAHPKQSILGDKQLMALRAGAMPEKAKAASFRAVYNIDLQQQLGLANIMGIEVAPSSLSVWADVADDFALVAMANSRSAVEREEVVRAAKRWLFGIVGSEVGQAYQLAKVRPTVRLNSQEKTTVVVATIGPKSLSHYIEGLSRK